MFPGGPNPSKLQSAPGSSKTPLVLIHDGGGTTFAYFFLGNMKRDVWTIHNPNYWKAQKWEGGMDEMARHYIKLIQNAGIRGNILLGGWSLGGLLSVVISRMVADDSSVLINVAGTILIDSPFHVPTSTLGTPLLDPDFGHLPKLIQESFKYCDDYLEFWDLPPWSGPSKAGKALTLTAGGKNFDVAPNEVLHLPLDGEWIVKDAKTLKQEDMPEKAIAPPPGILLRCVRRSERPKGLNRDCTIDIWRDEILLGWGGRYSDFLKATIDIDAGHFDMFDKFDEKKVERVSDMVIEALDILDSLVTSEK